MEGDGDKREEEQPWCLLDPYDSHLDARVERDALTVEALHTDGFQYLWKGIRSNYGVFSGVYMYEVKILKNLQVRMPETKTENQCLLRCGFSLPMSSLFLGDTAEGWGWGGTGKKSHKNQFADYGGPFTEGDVISCIVDLCTWTISFMKNGQFMGIAFDNIPPRAAEVGVFPHLLLKNVRCQVNFRRKCQWFEPPGSKIKFFEDDIDWRDTIVNPVDHPQSLSEAEFILLCGLPACGKTYYAQKLMEANPSKNYYLLGTNSVIDQMKVMNVHRMRNYADRWNELISQATPIFNRLVEIASKTPRNFILDQTNVYQNARRRKVAAFSEFGTRRCVTIVNDEEQLAQRTDKREREEGKCVPVQAVNQMRSNFVVPVLEDGFTQIVFPELPETEATAMINEIRNRGTSWARRNPGDRGQQPLSRLETRAPEQIGRHGETIQKPGTARSRSPPPPYANGTNRPQPNKGKGKGTSNHGWRNMGDFNGSRGN